MYHPTIAAIMSTSVETIDLSVIMDLQVVPVGITVELGELEVLGAARYSENQTDVESLPNRSNALFEKHQTMYALHDKGFFTAIPSVWGNNATYQVAIQLMRHKQLGVRCIGSYMTSAQMTAVITALWNTHMQPLKAAMRHLIYENADDAKIVKKLNRIGNVECHRLYKVIINNARIAWSLHADRTASYCIEALSTVRNMPDAVVCIIADYAVDVKSGLPNVHRLSCEIEQLEKEYRSERENYKEYLDMLQRHGDDDRAYQARMDAELGDLYAVIEEKTTLKDKLYSECIYGVA